MKRAYLIVRCFFLWLISALHFFVICPILVLIGILGDPRKRDWPQRFFFRNILRFAGAGFEVRYAPGFDRTRTCIFICNHVNLFDPFVIYSAIPQFVRGLELESHFRIPAYGWMMKRFGNVPVPEVRKPSDLKRTFRMTKAALDSGISLIAFPEGSRTLDGHVGPFERGVFHMAVQFGYPVVPMSIVGSFEFNKKTSWMLNPSKIVVHIHDTIETKDLGKANIEALRERVWQVVARPVHEAMAGSAHSAESAVSRSPGLA